MALRPEDVRSAAFSRPPIGVRGYNESQVDALLDRVAAALAGSRDPGLIEEARNASFARAGWGRRGYNPDEVDALLDLCVAELTRLDRPGAPTPARAGADHPDDPADLRPAASASTDSPRGRDGIRIRSAGDLRAIHLPPAGDYERGYHPKKADKLLTRMAAALQGTDSLTAAELGALRPPVTRRPGHGYQVDTFDRILAGVANELHHRGQRSL